MVPWKKLKPHPKNRNAHPKEQVERLTKLIRYQGVRAPIVVSNLSGYMVKGHGTLLAMQPILKDENETTVPVTYQDFEDEEQEILFLNSDSAIAAWADLDLPGIANDILDFGPFDIDLLGFENFTVDFAEKNAGNGDPDETPEPPKIPKSQLGDLWILGEHRLLCGDSTNAKQVARLMNGEKADMVFTDPPYNVAGKTQMESLSKLRPNSYGKLKNSSWDQDFDPATLFPSLDFVLSENSSVYVCCSHFLAGAIWAWMESWGDYYGGCVWTKTNPMPSMHKRHWTWDHEHVCYATKGKHVFNFPADGHTKATWEIAKSPSNDLHPTQKPVAIPEHAILHSSLTNSLVADLFLGSGSTLIACEKTNRRSFGMEIDPLYCDVILTRWAKFTGKDPVREDGVKWSEL